jgi:hypothetical protein
MAESIVRELMRADHVDPAAFEALLRSISARSPRPTARSLAKAGQHSFVVKSSPKAWCPPRKFDGSPKRGSCTVPRWIPGKG